jgi:hypothetical protein
VRDRDSEKPPLDLTGYELEALHRGVTDSFVQKLAAASTALVSSRKQEAGGCGLFARTLPCSAHVRPA